MWIHLELQLVKQIAVSLRSLGQHQAALELEERLTDETQNAQLNARYRSAARNAYQVDGEIEFDPNAVVSKGGDAGAYVMGWQWIAEEELSAASNSDFARVND